MTDTPLTASGSKWIPLKDEILYEGDLINNLGCYDQHPDYTSEFWRRPALFAEKFTFDRSRARAMYDRQLMFCAAASSGWEAFRIMERFPQKILEHSQAISAAAGDYLRDETGALVPDENGRPQGRKFFTIQRIGRVLEKEIMGADVFAINYRNQRVRAGIAAHNIRNPETGGRDAYIVTPDAREYPMRSFSKIHALSGGVEFEDIIWERHLWGPSIFFDMSGIIYDGDQAWSRNAALEKAIGLAIQYGSPLPLLVRRGQGFETPDIRGRPVSIVDQAYEDARHLVYEVRKRKYEGTEYETRSEPAAALLISRFMHDLKWRMDVPREQGGLDKDRASQVVKDHYASPGDMAKFDRLRALMLPFLAKECNWPTLHEILRRDKGLQKFWNEHVLPAANDPAPVDGIRKEVLSYLPRGGFRHPVLDKLVTHSRDPLDEAPDMDIADMPDMPDGLHEDVYAHDWDPKMFNDRNFARLGLHGHPDKDTDPDHYTFAQGAALLTTNAYRHDGIPPLDKPYTMLYLDSAAAGVLTAAYKKKHGVSDPRELKTKFDAHTQGGSTFAEAVGRENAANLRDRAQQLGRAKDYEGWRTRRKIGAVIPASDIETSLKGYEGRREAMNADMHECLKAAGAMHLPGETKETILRRLIGSEMTYLAIPAGPLEDPVTGAALIEAVSVILGQTPRSFSGGKYKFQIFMDYGHDKLPHERNPEKDLVPLDYADLIVHIGMQVKAEMELPGLPNMRAKTLAMLRLLEWHDRMIDPARRNALPVRDVFSGKDKLHNAIDFKQVNPGFLKTLPHEPRLPDYADEGEAVQTSKNPELDAMLSDPDFKAFLRPESEKPGNYYARLLATPTGKAALVKYIRTWGRDMPVPHPAKPGQDWVAPGHLLLYGIKDLTHWDVTRDLHPVCKDAYESWHKLNDRQRANVFNQRTVLVESPSVER